MNKNEKTEQLKSKFIEKAIKKHNGKYDYSKVEYKNSYTKVCIICKKHGEFWQTPLSHLYGGSGCPKCAGRNLTQEDIVSMFREKHGDKYNYSEVVYTKMHDKVKIICPIHGEFEQTPSKHLLGQGCPKCGVIERSSRQRLPIDKFIERARKIHGNKYDYSNVKYNKIIDKVKIICPIHGEFEQRGFDHLNCHGCSKCCQSSLERKIELLLKENNIEYIHQCDYKTFPWLGKLKLDFYLPNENIAIECQGSQHFIPIEHFGGEDEFEIIKERDNRKYQLCKENNLKILYFTEIKEVDYFLSEKLIKNDKDLLVEINKKGGIV